DTIDVSLGERSYPIHIGSSLLGNAELLRETVTARQVGIVTNDVVAKLYLKPLQNAFRDRDPRVVVLPVGEQHRALATLSRIFDELVDAEFHRDACLVALGGGVVGDITGFAAACYQRGI